MDRNQELHILREQLGDGVVTRREFINRALILTGSLATVSALLQESRPSAAASPASPAPAGRQPKQGGTLTVGKAGDFTTMDPHFRGANNQSAHLTSFDPVLRYGKDMKPVVELAASWEVKEDKFIVKLRQGIKFHNGREFVAEDVLFNFERAGDPNVGGRLVDFVKPITAVKAPDKYTVEFTFQGVPEVVVELLDSMFIVNKETAAQVKNKPVGTGPFKFAEWAPGDRARWTRYADYYKKGQPYVETLVQKAYNDSETQLVNLQAGQVDLVEFLLAKDVERVLGDKNLKLVKADVGSFWMLMVNVTHKPFDNKKVRQALNYMIDRKTISEKVFFGQSKPLVAPFYLQTHPGYDAKFESYYTFDLDKAKQLLTEAGFPNGFEATITGFAAFPECKNFSQIVMADAAKIGVRLKLDDLPSSQAYPKYLAGDFDILNGSQGSVHRDPVAFFTMNPATRLNNNITKYSNPEYTKLVTDGAATRDLVKRKEIYRKLNEIMLDESFLLLIAEYPKFSAMRNYVQDYSDDLNGYPIWNGIWLDK